ncbi:primosomal protein N' [Chryseobacterium shigense]|uniref:Replication restart protein PriA n=1 Tax=Chryseobacterium shigense TaxID=297244 RepID=A0A841MWS1_9FLAO|nr:primosomal protein N' [Chryseobacterium shigense]MBB6369396.1 primosomal protein N' (replication factor Y) [Chryseobacterium shigense]
MQYAQIVLPLNLKGSFTYKIPEELMPVIQLGMRVLVPFGGKKIYTGIVFEIHHSTPESFVAKEIISILDDKPILPEEQISFWNWLSEYYLCGLGEIYRFAFPSSLKLESETYLKLRPNIKVDFENLDVNEMYLIQALEVRQLINLTDIEAFIPKKEIIRTINSLIDLQYIEIDEKIAEKYKAKEVAYVKISNEVLKNQNLTDILIKLNRAAKQKDLFLAILEKQTEHPDIPVKKSELFEDGYFGTSHFNGLADKGLVEEYHMQKDRIESYEGEIEELEELSEQQKEAKTEIDEAFEEGKNVLLHGVTSSGKTHIYLEKIEECIQEGKNVLFLLPEISLTKQITQRLEKKYGRQLGFYHQKLTDFERVEVWRRIKQNDIKILIGTRNSLFLPFQDLGLIIVDEEHDSAYRPREASPYFNAKDAALVLGNFYKAGVILGSATPSVESYYNARKDKIKYIFLNERFGNVNLPEYEIINFKEAQESKKVTGNFSLHLIDEIKKTLDQKNQAIVLHNRRGYANVIECETCGYVNYCSNCDVVMTYHKAANEMKCHYCGQRASKPRTCPKCHSENLNERGVGVEQIHEEVSKMFPNSEVDRMDVDSMRKKFAYEKLYEKIEEGETDIIVGTQMISKGLDFDHIELVAIPKADSLLYVQDFRAEERAYQLITQVSGRAGRVSGKGKILIQTYNPDHSVFQLIKMNNPAKIYKYILTERQKFHYPPFTKLIMIELKHRKEDKVNRASQFLGSVLRKYLPEECVLGPERAQIARLNNLYQFQIMLKLPRGKKYDEFKKMVLLSLNEFDEITAYQSIKKDVFVDF